MPNISALVTATIDNLKPRNRILEASQCQQICEQYDISIENLMMALLLFAQQYAKAVVSDFNVGAVAKGKKLNDSGYANLYFAANVEFENRSLCHSIHAEQAVISVAWQQGETGVSSIATSAAPCGHCRQFLYELSHGQALPVLTPGSQLIEPLSYVSRDVSELLPDAFGPLELDNHQKFMKDANKLQKLTLDDALLSEAIIEKTLSEAGKSYAPYSGNFAACVIQTNDEKFYSGKSIENAAYNPSLPAFSAALINLVMGQVRNASLASIFAHVQRVVLVEFTSTASQIELSQLLLISCSKNLKLESYQANFSENSTIDKH